MADVISLAHVKSQSAASKKHGFLLEQIAQFEDQMGKTDLSVAWANTIDYAHQEMMSQYSDAYFNIFYDLVNIPDLTASVQCLSIGTGYPAARPKRANNQQVFMDHEENMVVHPYCTITQYSASKHEYFDFLAHMEPVNKTVKEIVVGFLQTLDPVTTEHVPPEMFLMLDVCDRLVNLPNIHMTLCDTGVEEDILYFTIAGSQRWFVVCLDYLHLANEHAKYVEKIGEFVRT